MRSKERLDDAGKAAAAREAQIRSSSRREQRDAAMKQLRWIMARVAKRAVLLVLDGWRRGAAAGRVAEVVMRGEKEKARAVKSK